MKMETGQEDDAGEEGEKVLHQGEDEPAVVTRTALLNEEIRHHSGTDSESESSERSRASEKRESLNESLKGMVCEDCERSEKGIALGQWVRKCQACDQKKDFVDKKPPQDLRVEDMLEEERDEMDSEVKDETMFMAASRFVMEVNMNTDELWNDSMKSSRNESFSVEHEQVDLLGSEVTKSLTLTASEDGKVIKKKESLFIAKKEPKPLIATDLTPRKEKIGHPKGRSSVEKETAMYNERREQSVEIDSQKTKEELEMEKRERGWVNGRSSNYLKTVPVKNAGMADVISPGKERKERVKVKALKEKPDTQRILGLVARRSASRMTSPKQRNRDTDKGDGELARLDTMTMTSVVPPPSTSHEINQEITKLGDLHSELTARSDNGLVHDITERKILHSNMQNGISRSKPLILSGEDPDSNFSSPSTTCRMSDNPLYGAQRILGLVAKRSGSRMTSPKHQSLAPDQRDGELAGPDVMKITTVVLPSSRSHERDQEVTKLEEARSETTPRSAGGSLRDDSEGSTLPSHLEQGVSRSQPQILSRQNSETKFSKPTGTSCRVNDNPLYRTNSDCEPRSRTLNEVANKSLCTLNLQSSSEKVAEPPERTSQQPSQKQDQVESSKKQSNCVTLESTPSNESGLPSPIFISPEPNGTENMRISLQLGAEYAAPEIETLEEECSSTPTCRIPLENNVRLRELGSETSNDEESSTEGPTNVEVVINGRRSSSLRRARDVASKNRYEKKEVTFKQEPELIPYKTKEWGRSLLWPAHLMFRALGSALKFVLFVVYVLRSVVYGVSKPVRLLKSITAKGVGRLGSRILGHSRDGCTSGSGYSGCGCVTKAYILLVLSSLFFTSLFDLDLYLINRFIEGQVVIRETLNFDFTKEHPVAEVNLLSPQILDKAKGYFPDKEVMAARAFPESHVFSVIVHLTVPESDYNHKIGMFQVVAETFSARGHLLEKAGRASMLKYHSPPVRYLKSILMGLPVILGLCDESQTLSIRVMESQEENEFAPTASVRVVLVPTAGHSKGSGVPEIYDAQMQVVAQCPWMREVARNWVWSLYLYSGVGLFVFEALLLLCCCRRVLPQKVRGNSSEEPACTVSRSGPERGQRNMPAIRKNLRRHIYFQRSLPLALPSTSTSLDSTSVARCNNTTFEEIQVARGADSASITEL